METKSFVETIKAASSFMGSGVTEGVWGGLSIHDTEVWASDGFCAIRLEFVQKTGITGVVQGTPFLKLLSQIDSEEVDFEQTDNELKISAGTVSAKYPIESLDDYPKIDEWIQTDFAGAVDVGEICDCFSACLWSEIVKCEGILGSIVCRQSDKFATFSTCDGNRIAHVTTEQTLPAEAFLLPASVMTSAKLALLKDHAQSISLVENKKGSRLAFKLNDGEVSVPVSTDRLGAFPTDKIDEHLRPFKNPDVNITSLMIPEGLGKSLRKFVEIEKLDHFKQTNFSLVFQDDKIGLFLKNRIVGELTELTPIDDLEAVNKLNGVVIEVSAGQLAAILKDAQEVRFDKKEPTKLYFIGKDDESNIRREMLIAT